MQLGDVSIYVDPPVIRTRTVEDKEGAVSAYDSERRTCENLLVMGFTNSGGKDLTLRVKWLSRRIKELEREIHLAMLKGKKVFK